MPQREECSLLTFAGWSCTDFFSRRKSTPPGVLAQDLAFRDKRAEELRLTLWWQRFLLVPFPVWVKFM